MVIPGTIKGQPVTRIGDGVFKGKFLTYLYLPGSVTEIGDDAFADNPFTSITIEANIDIDVIYEAFGEIGFVYAYWYYGGAGTYTRGGGNWAKGTQEKDGNYWYTESGWKATVTGYAGSGTVMVIPGTIGGWPVTAIGYGAFSDKQLTSVTIPSGVTEIGWHAFYGNQLTGVTIPDSVTVIGGGAFSSNQLTSVDIPESVTSLSGFDNNQLKSVTIPDSVTEIGSLAFSDNQLTSVTIGNSVTEIGTAAFQNNQLISVDIPDSVTYLSGFNNNQLTSITIPESVTEIGGGAFSGNQLTGLTIPDSVTAIREWAFVSNPLTSVTIPAGVSLISSPFPGGLDTVYTTTNKKAAGTYTRSSTSSTTWTKSGGSSGGGGPTAITGTWIGTADGNVLTIGNTDWENVNGYGNYYKGTYTYGGNTGTFTITHIKASAGSAWGAASGTGIGTVTGNALAITFTWTSPFADTVSLAFTKQGGSYSGGYPEDNPIPIGQNFKRGGN
jgi:hypothetical protein